MALGTGPSVTWQLCCCRAADCRRRPARMGCAIRGSAIPCLATSCSLRTGTPVTNQNSLHGRGFSVHRHCCRGRSGLLADACAHQALGTATNVTSCTYAQQCRHSLRPGSVFHAAASTSTAPVVPTVAAVVWHGDGLYWSGPAIDCTYSGCRCHELDTTTCTANRLMASPYNRAGCWDCTYAAPW